MRPKKKKQPDLRLDKVIKLDTIFKSKNWIINENNEQSEYLKYIELLNFLNDNEEQELIVELTERFKCIRIKEYFDHIIIALNKLHTAFPKISVFKVLPLVSEGDMKNELTKSGQVIFYSFKGREIYNYINYRVTYDTTIKNINGLGNIKLENNEKILIVDDFIGTGNSAIKAVKNLDDKFKDNIIFLCIAILQIGKDFLEKNGYKVFYSEIFYKGISDYYSNSDVIRKTEIMTSIENKISKRNDISSTYRFGYKQCEALLCMCRVPNNTFPVYWIDDQVSPYKRF